MRADSIGYCAMNDGAGTANAFLIPFDENFGARLRSVQRLHQRFTANSSAALPSGSQLSRIQRARLVLFVRALDGEQEGTSRREIAAVLLDRRARNIPAIEWTNAALRKSVNRIIVGSQSHAERRLSRSFFVATRARATLSAIRCPKAGARAIGDVRPVVMNKLCKMLAASGQSLRRVFPTAPIVLHARLRSVAVSGSGPERLGGSSCLPRLRRYSALRPNARRCRVPRSVRPDAREASLHRHGPGVPQARRSRRLCDRRSRRPGPPSATQLHVRSRPAATSHGAHFASAPARAVEWCHGCAARSTISRSNCYGPGPATSRRATHRT